MRASCGDSASRAVSPSHVLVLATLPQCVQLRTHFPRPGSRAAAVVECKGGERAQRGSAGVLTANEREKLPRLLPRSARAALARSRQFTASAARLRTTLALATNDARATNDTRSHCEQRSLSRRGQRSLTRSAFLPSSFPHSFALCVAYRFTVGYLNCSLLLFASVKRPGGSCRGVFVATSVASNWRVNCAIRSVVIARRKRGVCGWLPSRRCAFGGRYVAIRALAGSRLYILCSRRMSASAPYVR